MSKTRWRVGIDGDIDKSGFCVIKYTTFGKKEITTLTTMPFFDVINTIHSIYKEATENGDSLLVCLEAGWLNKVANYHKAPSL